MPAAGRRIYIIGIALFVVMAALSPFFFVQSSEKMPAKHATEGSSSSDWIAIPLSKMIGTADLIVSGSVTKVWDTTYCFCVKKALKGNPDEKPIEVRKIRPDRFASVQPAPYQKDQVFLLFLTAPDRSRKDLPWKVMGIGGEGQMPVTKGFVYFPQNQIEGIPFGDYDVYGVTQFIQRFDSSLFFDAVEEYGNCFFWTRDPSDGQFYAHKVCEDVAQSRYEGKSFIHNFLAAQTRTRIPEGR